MDVSGHYDFDVDDYPLLAPPSPRVRSLGIQPPDITLERAVPVRWWCTVIGGTGDWLEFAGTEQLLWDGNWDRQQPLQLNDRDDSEGDFKRRLSLAATSLLVPAYLLEFRLSPTPLRYVIFDAPRVWTGYYKPVVFLGPESQGPLWTGDPPSSVTLTPIPFFSDLS